MALLDSSDFSDNSGWTLVETTGTQTFNASHLSMNPCLKHVCAGQGYGQMGMYRTTGQTGASGHVIYIDYATDGATQETNFGLTDDASILRAGKGNVYTWAGFQTYNGTGVVGNKESIILSTIYNFKFVIAANGTFQPFMHTDDGTAQQDISSWTSLGATTVVATFDATASTIRFNIDNFKGSVNTHAWRRFNYTDDGIVNIPSVAGGGTGATKQIRQRRQRFYRREE